MSNSTILKENHDIDEHKTETIPVVPDTINDKGDRAEAMLAATANIEKPQQEKNKLTESPKPSTIHVNFSSNSDKIKIQSKATGEKNVVVAANKKIHLIHGRLYFIPVDSEVNSDEYGNMKQFSETTDKYDVKYIKNSIACIDPILHNAIIEDTQQLCVLW